MDNIASKVIDALGGTSAVARMIEAPVTTVHSWRKIGIPTSRLAHLKLAAHVAGLSGKLETALADAPRAEAA